MKMIYPIYTHNIAADIVERFEDVLHKNNVFIPSPEDEENDRAKDDYGLYGSVYSDLLDYTEDTLIEMIDDLLKKIVAHYDMQDEIPRESFVVDGEFYQEY